MRDEIFIIGEAEIASLIKHEILKETDFVTHENKYDYEFEFISQTKDAKKPYQAIMMMNQKEMKDFVKCDKVSEMANLSDTQLDKVGKMLGINQEILTGNIE